MWAESVSITVFCLFLLLLAFSLFGSPEPGFSLSFSLSLS